MNKFIRKNLPPDMVMNYKKIYIYYNYYGIDISNLRTIGKLVNSDPEKKVLIDYTKSILIE